VDLFQAQQKSHVVCPDCGKNSITFDTYMYLSVPIVGHNKLSLVVDIFHLGVDYEDKEAPNKPTRHVFHVNKYDKVKELQTRIAQKYKAKRHLVLLYENDRMRVARELDENMVLGMVPQREATACYILKDWNAVVTPAEIKKKKITLALAKLSHYAKGAKKMFGMPLLISFLNIHSSREVHQTVYRRLFAWVGTTADVLCAPPDADDDEKWDAMLASEALPYRLCFSVSASRYSHSRTYKGLSSEDIALPSALRERKEISLRIEWSDAAMSALQSMMNKVVVDGAYSEWRAQNKAKEERGQRSALTLYDCLNAYVSTETLSENDLWYCSECKKHQMATKKLDLWSFPEILIIHLKRFQVLGHGRFGRGEKISTFVDCPIRGLDLTPYLINDGAETRSEQTMPIYDLYAVSCHSGSCGGGHYTAYALNAETDRWFYFNDSSVRPAKQSDIVSQSTYVLFYKKCH